MSSYDLVMHESPGPLGQVAEQLPTPVRSWAFAVNTAVECSDIEITLLSFVVVGGARPRHRAGPHPQPPGRSPDVSARALADNRVDGSPLALLPAHVLPHGDMAWVSWPYKRPPHGAWVFRFQLPPSPRASKMLAALAD